MKKTSYLGLSVLLAASLAACSDDETKQENNEKQTAEQSEDQVIDEGDKLVYLVDLDEETKKQSEAIKYDYLELEVDYEGFGNSYEAEYEKLNDGLNAEIDDEINNRHLTAHTAFNKLYPVFQRMKFTADTPKEDVIKEVLDGFGLPENYEDFQLQVIFSDGNIMEINEE